MLKEEVIGCGVGSVYVEIGMYSRVSMVGFITGSGLTVGVDIEGERPLVTVGFTSTAGFVSGGAL